MAGAAAAVALWSAGCRSGVEHGGDGFDLHQLVVVAKHGHAQQSAGDIVIPKTIPDYLPGSHQVLFPC